MSQQWYFSKNNQQQGPVSPEQLKQLAASGQLQPSDLVWKEGMGQWTTASSIKGLFAAPAAPPRPISPPSTPTKTPVKNTLPQPTPKPPSAGSKWAWLTDKNHPVSTIIGGIISVLAVVGLSAHMLLQFTGMYRAKSGSQQSVLKGSYDNAKANDNHSKSTERINEAISSIFFAGTTRGENAGTPPQAIQGDEFIQVPPTAKLLSDAVLDESYFPVIPSKQVEEKVVRLNDTGWAWFVEPIKFPSPDRITSESGIFSMYQDGVRKAFEVCKDKEPQLTIRRRRVSDGCIRISTEVVDGQTELVTWEPLLKLGAKKGDRWEWQDEVKHLTFEVIEFFDFQGETVALVKKHGNVKWPSGGLLHCETMTWYCRGFGVAREQSFVSPNAENSGNSPTKRFQYALIRKPLMW